MKRLMIATLTLLALMTLVAPPPAFALSGETCEIDQGDPDIMVGAISLGDFLCGWKENSSPHVNPEIVYSCTMANGMSGDKTCQDHNDWIYYTQRTPALCSNPQPKQDHWLYDPWVTICTECSTGSSLMDSIISWLDEYYSNI